ncbi:S41 family peptidase [Magnetospirillum gryphiswaldense]|uniref:Carboxy-terminal-processing protease n=1 Tax=Magnetospirillum gryphiswaldense (strain DSM 6361 / JCM 21280 / NBRC 15271 / MSR-1) TaxID=431944 RepID=V6F648_MAGGM|nr:S41 family peptidase [Magnetospirillum gryphiswaldense]AVM75173.1 putative CtpA-like serine protease [Magnetospirillum gryphiswaldense MSR-1]AVM79076.1 putative CtpA-like serine protease [Magnetospirillum gryphiswaldense]CDL00919.1 putative carboxy-terminal-processing protease [Magnetospirillum gryphiswaldense MSR-1 v2]
MRLSLAFALILALWSAPAHADRADRETLRQAFHKAGISVKLAERQVDLLDEIIEAIADRHVDAPDSHVLADKMAAAIAAKNQPLDEAVKAGLAELTHVLDPHTAYLPPNEWNDMQVSVSGKFSGVGMELAMKDKAVMVVSPIDGSPAAQAGIRTDDRVLAVDGESVDGLTLGQVVARIRGPVGKEVRLRLRNPAGADRDLAIIRDVIRLQPVKGRLDGDIGYVRVSQFSGGVAALLRSQVMELDRQSAFGLKGLVLDLRRNPGGVLDEAVKMADLFLGDVAIVSTKARNPADNDSRYGRQGEIVAGTPMVVLIDGGSASASEIVAGALKDQGRATLVGQKSYGKGSVQVLEEVSEGGVRVTIARYFRPNKQPVDGVGISPDIEITPAENSDPQLERALEVVRKR